MSVTVMPSNAYDTANELLLSIGAYDWKEDRDLAKPTRNEATQAPLDVWDEGALNIAATATTIIVAAMTLF